MMNCIIMRLVQTQSSPADTSYSLSGNLNNVPQSCVVLMAISDSEQITSLVFIWLCLKSDEDVNKQNIGAEVKYLCVQLMSTCQQSAPQYTEI